MKEKAKELVDKYYYSMNPNAPDCNISYNQAKQAAIIAVDEILSFMINILQWDIKHNGNIEYWYEVKSEIEKL